MSSVSGSESPWSNTWTWILEGVIKSLFYLTTTENIFLFDADIEVFEDLSHLLFGITRYVDSQTPSFPYLGFKL